MMINSYVSSGKHAKKLWETFTTLGKVHHAMNGKTHYFDWAIFDRYVELPEGK